MKGLGKIMDDMTDTMTDTVTEDNLVITEINKNEVGRIAEWISPAALLRVANPDVHIIVAVENDSLVAVMVAESTESVLNIIDIYTHEENRRAHIAGTMLLEFVDYYDEMTDYSLRYVQAEFDENNHVAAAFYKALGFDIVRDETAKKVTYTLQTISDSEVLNKTYTLPPKFVLLNYKELDNIRRKAMYRQIEQSGGIPVDLFSDNADDLLSYSLWKDDKIVSIAEILINDNEIILGQFFVVQNDINPVMYMLKTMLGLLKDIYSPDTPFSIYITQDASARLLTGMLGNGYKSEYLMRAVLNLEEYDADNMGGGLII